MKIEEIDYMKKRGYEMFVRTDYLRSCEYCGHIDSFDYCSSCHREKKKITIIEFVKITDQDIKL